MVCKEMLSTENTLAGLALVLFSVSVRAALESVAAVGKGAGENISGSAVKRRNQVFLSTSKFSFVWGNSG